MTHFPVPAPTLALSEQQLATWSHQGAVDSSKKTYASVKYALDQSARLTGRGYSVFLQGSYGNDTNIRADSDVDVVVMLEDAFWRDISKLGPLEAMLYQQAFSDASYGFGEFRNDVLAGLRSHYGANLVSEGQNSLKVKPASGRLGADVIVCLQYRNYRHFWSLTSQEYVEGVAFRRRDGNLIVNYPKLHSEACTSKNKATSSWFKPTVRVFKNMRSRLVEGRKIGEDCAPSYFVENLIFNSPDVCFGTSFQSTILSVTSALLQLDLSRTTCANGQMVLFGDRPEQWNVTNCQQFLIALADMLLGN
ncbi:MAG TPA: nucleotidyltransferase [Bryobacteraceae bacterium]|nr:nucleotidyltransferase [Bryobacteraceae bacterium]